MGSQRVGHGWAIEMNWTELLHHLFILFMGFSRQEFWSGLLYCFGPLLSTIKKKQYGTEAEDTKKKWQKYTEELYKKDLHDQDNHDGMITHLEPDILECEVKGALGQSQWRWWNSSWVISDPKRWCCESATLSMPANLENSAVATELEKVSFHSNPKERQCQRMFRLPHNCTHFTC